LACIVGDETREDRDHRPYVLELAEQLERPRVRLCGQTVSPRMQLELSNRSQLRPPFRAQSRPLLGLIELRGMAFAGVGRLWVSGLPERPSRVWRRQATYP
jgi:hypothetical protein